MTTLINKRYIKEALRLMTMCSEAGVPFEVGAVYNGIIVCYPCYGKGRISDAVCHDSSYGRSNGNLELMGLTNDEDEVEGDLTAEEVFARWHKHYLENKE